MRKIYVSFAAEISRDDQRDSHSHLESHFHAHLYFTCSSRVEDVQDVQPVDKSIRPGTGFSKLPKNCLSFSQLLPNFFLSFS